MGPLETACCGACPAFLLLCAGWLDAGLRAVASLLTQPAAASLLADCDDAFRSIDYSNIVGCIRKAVSIAVSSPSRCSSSSSSSCQPAASAAHGSEVGASCPSSRPPDVASCRAALAAGCAQG